MTHHDTHHDASVQAAADPAEALAPTTALTHHDTSCRTMTHPAQAAADTAEALAGDGTAGIAPRAGSAEVTPMTRHDAP